MGDGLTVEQLETLQNLVDKAAASLTGDLDGEQVALYDLAFCQAELLAAQSLTRLANMEANDVLAAAAAYYSAEVSNSIVQRFARFPAAWGLTTSELPDPGDEWLNPSRIAELGAQFLAEGIPAPTEDSEHSIIRNTFHDFTNEVVSPLAEEVHRQDLLIPPAILEPLKEMGCFGLSVPVRFGGLKPDDHEDSQGMVIVTEELSRGSLGAAGSLITRPEIMARAILEGGTDEQKARWLPGIAAGDPLCAISVTEPNTGSDVASVALKATPTEGGWLLNGAKTWCTFAGAAGAVLVLARTNPDTSLAHKGLSLFVVHKPVFDGHDFEYEQQGGGRLQGRAIPTIGYRGMHSYEMFYDDFFVPQDDLIGGEAGTGRGFYYTMRGFMGGRLQTAARACGVMRAAFEDAAQYTNERTVFGKPVAAYPLSSAKFAKMGAMICACRALTRDVADLMDEGAGAMEASLVKLIACRSAEWVTREAVQLFGGMGYAEESAVSRYFVDARVLSIFEGAEETLAVRVIGKALVDQQRQRTSV